MIKSIVVMIVAVVVALNSSAAFRVTKDYGYGIKTYHDSRGGHAVNFGYGWHGARKSGNRCKYNVSKNNAVLETTQISGFNYAKEIENPCKTCNGEGHVRCKICNGHRRGCIRCDGTFHVKCKVCNGSGKAQKYKHR